MREAAACDDVQVNFGVILDESMADAVKITVIATGFQPPSVLAMQGKPVEVRTRLELPPREPEPEPEPGPVVEPEPEPEPMMAAPEPPPLDLEDLDTPAYLRQGRLLN